MAEHCGDLENWYVGCREDYSLTRKQNSYNAFDVVNAGCTRAAQLLPTFARSMVYSL